MTSKAYALDRRCHRLMRSWSARCVAMGGAARTVMRLSNICGLSNLEHKEKARRKHCSRTGIGGPNVSVIGQDCDGAERW